MVTCGCWRGDTPSSLSSPTSPEWRRRFRLEEQERVNSHMVEHTDISLTSSVTLVFYNTPPSSSIMHEAPACCRLCITAGRWPAASGGLMDFSFAGRLNIYSSAPSRSVCDAETRKNQAPVWSNWRYKPQFVTGPKPKWSASYWLTSNEAYCDLLFLINIFLFEDSTLCNLTGNLCITIIIIISSFKGWSQSFSEHQSQLANYLDFWSSDISSSISNINDLWEALLQLWSAHLSVSFLLMFFHPITASRPVLGKLLDWWGHSQWNNL